MTSQLTCDLEETLCRAAEGIALAQSIRRTLAQETPERLWRFAR